jgi:hypothetical protein
VDSESIKGPCKFESLNPDGSGVITVITNNMAYFDVEASRRSKPCPTKKLRVAGHHLGSGKSLMDAPKNDESCSNGTWWQGKSFDDRKPWLADNVDTKPISILGLDLWERF